MTELDWEKNRSSHSVALRGRTALAMIVGAICLLSNAPNSAAVDDDDRYSSWFFTSEEVAAAYQYQQNYGERLRFPLRAGPCLFAAANLRPPTGAIHWRFHAALF